MFTIPDKGTAAHDTQSILFQEYLGILSGGINGSECVISGCAVTANGSNMVLAVAAGKVKSGGIAKIVSAATPTISAADTTYPRLDYVFVDSTGTVAIRTGTPAANPKPPIKASTDVVLAVVYVPQTFPLINQAMVVDMRVMRSGSKQTIPITAAALIPRKETGKGCSTLAVVTGAAGQPDIPYLAFDPTIPQYAGIVLPMPKGWDEGTVTAEFQWRRAANIAAGNVVWGMRAVAVSDNDTPVTNFGAEATVISAAKTTLANFVLTVETGACTIGGSPVEGDLVFFEFFRKADDAINDTLTDASWLTSVRLHYNTDVDSDA